MSAKTKRITLSATTLVALAALLALVFSVWPPSRSGGQTPPYDNGNPCDNCDSDGPTGGPGPCPPGEGPGGCEEEESDTPGDSGDDEGCEDDSGTGNDFSSYSGNAKRKITDITVFGSVGMDPLRFSRYSNTRTSAVSANRGPFGKEGAWSHKYLWWMRDSASGSTPGVKVAFPSGSDIQFVQDATDPALWLPATDLSGRIVQSGDDFRMERNDGYLYHFKRYLNSNNAYYYRIEAIDDSEGNRTAFTYNSVTDTTVRKVTDASGRFLQFSYTNLGPFLQQETELGRNTYGETAGVWNEVTVTNTTAFRWLALFTVNDYHNAEAVPVAELEFYDENNNLITGTPFFSDPVFAAGQEGDKAFDADTATWYRYAQMRNGYVGLDCGTARQVSRIRYFIPSGVVANVPVVRFVGLNNAATANNVLTRVTSSDGRFVDYGYSVFEDASGWFKWALLNTVSYPDSTVASYTYAQIHDFTQPLLTQAVDPRLDGRFVNVAYEFDPSTVLGFTKAEKSGLTGEVVASSSFDSAHKPKFVYPNGRVKKLQYGSNGRLQQVTNGNGGVTSYSYENGTGYMTSRTDPLGRTTSFARDAEARPTLTTLPDGTTVATTYDTAGRVLTQTVTAGTVSRVTTHQYDAAGRRTRTDHPDGTYETWTYNNFGQPLTHRQRNSGVETWTYSATGLKLTHTDAVGATTTFAYDALDRLASKSDALGRATTYLHNDRGQITLVTNPDGTTAASAYDDFGNVITTTDEAGHVTAHTWNEFKQRLTTTDALGRTTVFAYAPAAGGASGSTCGGCNTAGKPTLITLPSGRQIRHEYDLEWNLLSTTIGHGTPEASTTSYRYNAAFKVDRITDPLGRYSYLTYDSRDRLISFKDIRVLTTTFTYDGFGNRLTETQPGNRVSTFTYDAMDRLLTVTDPLNQTTSYAYDIGGNRVLTQSPGGRQVTAAYDLDNQILQTTSGAGTAEAASTAYAYDLAGNLLTETDPLGRVTTHAYDLRDRRASTTDPLGRVILFGYTLDGLLASTQCPTVPLRHGPTMPRASSPP